MLEQVVQTAEQALDRSPQSHLIMPPISHSLERDGVNMVRNEGAVGTRSVPNTLTDHTTEHGLESFFIAVLVVPHALNCATDAHLATCNLDSGIEQVQVGQLAIDAVIQNVQLVETMTPRAGWILDGNGSLKSTTFDGQGLDFRGVVSVVISIDPGLRACGDVAGNQYYDVLGPK